MSSMEYLAVQKNKILVATLSSWLVCLSPIALASDSVWYAGGEIGSSSFDLKLPGGYSTNQSGLTQDKSDVGFAGFVGYRINQFVSGEVGYLDLGKYSLKNQAGDTASAEFKGVTGNLLWRYALNDRWALTAKTGLLLAAGKARAQVSGTGYSQSKSSVAPLLGIGVDYALDKKWTLRGQYLDVGAASVAEAVGTKVKLRDSFISFGVLYDF